MSTIRLKYIYLLLCLYLVFTIACRSFFPSTYSLIINPIFWIITLLIIKYTHNDNFNRETSENKIYIKKIIIIMLFYSIIYFATGLLLGYVKSPFSHKFITILKNIFQYIVSVFAIEYVRSTLVKANYKFKPVLIFTIILFLLLDLNLDTTFSYLSDSEEFFKYFFEIILPLIFSELICTYLVYKGNYKISFIYLAILNLLKIFLPIYPDLDWFGTGILGLVLPVATYSYIKIPKRNKRKDKKKNNPISLILSVIFVIVFGAFMMGLFKYEPIAILSNSMYPTYTRGDVLVICKPDKNELINLKKNNIIVYRIENQYVAHRIVEVIEEDGIKYYKTKGDNNNSEDYNPVYEDQIVGIYKFHIKYIGYPSVYLNDLFKNEKAKVETK